LWLLEERHDAVYAHECLETVQELRDRLENAFTFELEGDGDVTDFVKMFLNGIITYAEFEQKVPLNALRMYDARHQFIGKFRGGDTPEAGEDIGAEEAKSGKEDEKDEDEPIETKVPSFRTQPRVHTSIQRTVLDELTNRVNRATTAIVEFFPALDNSGKDHQQLFSGDSEHSTNSASRLFGLIPSSRRNSSFAINTTTPTPTPDQQLGVPADSVHDGSETSTVAGTEDLPASQQDSPQELTGASSQANVIRSVPGHRAAQKYSSPPVPAAAAGAGVGAGSGGHAAASSSRFHRYVGRLKQWDMFGIMRTDFKMNVMCAADHPYLGLICSSLRVTRTTTVERHL
jgi:hypothetical protein